MFNTMRKGSLCGLSMVAPMPHMQVPATCVWAARGDMVWGQTHRDFGSWLPNN